MADQERQFTAEDVERARAEGALSVFGVVYSWPRVRDWLNEHTTGLDEIAAASGVPYAAFALEVSRVCDVRCVQSVTVADLAELDASVAKSVVVARAALDEADGGDQEEGA